MTGCDESHGERDGSLFSVPTLRSLLSDINGAADGDRASPRFAVLIERVSISMSSSASLARSSATRRGTHELSLDVAFTRRRYGPCLTIVIGEPGTGTENQRIRKLHR